jgi:hypothetical protein
VLPSDKSEEDAGENGSIDSDQNPWFWKSLPRPIHKEDNDDNETN